MSRGSNSICCQPKCPIRHKNDAVCQLHGLTKSGRAKREYYWGNRNINNVHDGLIYYLEDTYACT